VALGRVKILAHDVLLPCYCHCGIAASILGGFDHVGKAGIDEVHDHLVVQGRERMYRQSVPLEY
jgi:hypothetical protein